MAGKTVSSVAKDGYIYVRYSLDGVRLFTGAHQVAFLLETGDWLYPSLEIDHENGVRSDNRWDNFRFAVRLENGKNRKMSVRNKTGFKGVFPHQKKPGRFTASITVDYRRHHLGQFGSAIEAARAYDVAALKHHGQFARTNADLGLL